MVFVFANTSAFISVTGGFFCEFCVRLSDLRIISCTVFEFDRYRIFRIFF